LALGKNLYQHPLMGTAIAYEPTMNELVVFFSRSVAELDEVTFRNLRENMLAACATLLSEPCCIRRPAEVRAGELDQELS
jgi:hypothetical protein